jgi:predicted lipase
MAAYDYKRGVSGVYYSKIAYCPVDKIESWTCDACSMFQMVNLTTILLPAQQSQGYVGYNTVANEIVMAFRGTVDLQGWIVDGDFFQTNYTEDAACHGCKVHEGLWWSYEKMAEKLLPAVQVLAAAHPTADIFVTGHSMGAAQSGFAFPDVVRHVVTQGKKRLYNFGCPRLGNPAWTRWLDNVLEPQHEHYRCTNYGDPVPRMAPRVFDKLHLGDWIHTPREVYYKDAFGKPTAFRVCNGTVTEEDPTCNDATPLFDRSFRYHTTYLGIGMGCFL